MSRYSGPWVVVDLPGGRLSHPCPSDPVSVGRVLLRLTAAIDGSLLPLARWSFEVGPVREHRWPGLPSDGDPECIAWRCARCGEWVSELGPETDDECPGPRGDGTEVDL